MGKMKYILNNKQKKSDFAHSQPHYRPVDSISSSYWTIEPKKTTKKTNTRKSIKTQFLSTFASWWSMRWVWAEYEQSHPAVLLLPAMCVWVCLCRWLWYPVCVCVWGLSQRQQLRHCSSTRCYHSFWFCITAWRMGPRGLASVAARLLPQLLSGSWFSLNRLFHKEKTSALSPLLR